jgi:hypothetical protein
MRPAAHQTRAQHLAKAYKPRADADKADQHMQQSESGQSRHDAIPPGKRDDTQERYHTAIAPDCPIRASLANIFRQDGNGLF